MAWPEDKTRVRKIKPSPIMQKANQATGKAFQVAADVADKYAGGAGLRELARGSSAVAAGFSDDLQRNTVARQARRGEIPYGDQGQTLDRFKQRVENRRYGSAPQSNQAATPQVGRRVPNDIAERARKQLSGNTNSGMISGTNGILLTNRNGEPRIEGDLASFKQRDKAIRGSRGVSQTTQVGNMDVSFDRSVPESARQRFLAQPSAPGTRRVPGIGLVDPGRNKPQAGPEPPRPMTLEERKAAGIGWKTARTQLENQWQDYTSSQNNATELARQRIAETGSNQRAGGQLAAEQAKIGLEGQRLGLDAERIGSENALRSRQIEDADIDLSMKKQIQDYFTKASAGDKDALQIYNALTGKGESKYQIVNREDDMGNKVPYLIDPKNNRMMEIGLRERAQPVPGSEKDMTPGMIYLNARGELARYLGNGEFAPMDEGWTDLK